MSVFRVEDGVGERFERFGVERDAGQRGSLGTRTVHAHVRSACTFDRSKAPRSPSPLGRRQLRPSSRAEVARVHGIERSVRSLRANGRRPASRLSLAEEARGGRLPARPGYI